MNFLISANTDIGSKSANQDSLSTLVLNTAQGRMVFAVLCDGMGGLEHGEMASACTVRAFRNWALTVLPQMCGAPLEDVAIRHQWQEMITDLNRRIGQYAVQAGTRMGTTVVAILLTQDRYYIVNVGDSRVYELTDEIRQLTRDHSVVAREIEAGNITPEEAEHHPKRNVLTQCVGASRNAIGDMYFGDVKQNAVYMLCSDGFRHEPSQSELFEALCPAVLLDEDTMNRNAEALISLNKERGEDDNISVVLVRTF